VVPEGIIDDIVNGLHLKRVGQPTDMVGTCLFLLSDDASWVTAQILAVDGGQIIRA
jgi:NAD(P)-dependent dehydrogenase (short-subunit alcohol dehydrogenase family)